MRISNSVNSVIHEHSSDCVVLELCEHFWQLCFNKENECVQRAELNDLQRKFPEDLWKEDLAVFIEELDVSFVLQLFFVVSTCSVSTSTRLNKPFITVSKLLCLLYKQLEIIYWKFSQHIIHHVFLCCDLYSLIVSSCFFAIF